jgi:hypothetical protein
MGVPLSSFKESNPGPAGEDAEFVLANFAMSDHTFSTRARRDGSV